MANDFPAVLSAAIQRRRLTLDALSTRLKELGTPVSIATLSYWQTGRSLPSRARSLQALRSLEMLLEVAPGHLVSALPGIHEEDLQGPDHSLTSQVPLRRALDEMGLDRDNSQLRTLTLQDSMVIGTGGSEQRRTTRQLVRAEADGVDRLSVVMQHSDDDGHATPSPRLETGLGCRVGRSRTVEELQLVVHELLLPRRLSRGEAVMFDYSTLWPSDERTETGFQRFVTATTHFLVLDVTFTDGACSSAHHVHGPCADTPSDELVRTRLAAGRHVQQVLRHAPAGLHGLEWVPAR